MAEPSMKDLIARLDRIESMFAERIPGGGVTDPPPDSWGGGWFPFPFPRPRFPFPFPQPGDPSPIDLSRLTKAQLAVTREMIKTERFRLDAMEKLINDQMKSMK